MNANTVDTYNDKKIVRNQRRKLLNSIIHGIDMNDNKSVEIIDLCTPPDMNINEIPLVSTTVIQQNTSISNKSIEQLLNLSQRLLILPLYPSNNNNNHDGSYYLLLTNIPPNQLTQKERARRNSNSLKSITFDIINYNSTISSFLREKYQTYFSDLIERLKVPMNILDYNYTRLVKYIKMLTYEQIHIFNLRPHEIESIDEKEYPLALEFFLQFDVNLFYMKTCSFRFARPRSIDEGLFCLREPEARYDLTACGNCALCYPQYDMTHRLKNYIVKFSQTHKHIFVNGYEAILNCSASCHTQNIIYALTCPCGKYEYIGATKNSLNDRLKKHREHGNRIIHEFLLGEKNIQRELLRPKDNEILRKDRMKLYQHSVRCSVAMQIFLDANPQYWRFIPMTLEESETSEQRMIQRSVFEEKLSCNLRSKEDSFLCVETVPKPPSGYNFSNRQIVLQTKYFHQKRDKNLPNQNIDLYDVTIVAILPENCSNMFRYIIESLFITHAETNLNTIGNVLNKNQQQEENYYPLDNPWLIRGNQWCQGLLRRPIPPLRLQNNGVTTNTSN